MSLPARSGDDRLGQVEVDLRALEARVVALERALAAPAPRADALSRAAAPDFARPEGLGWLPDLPSLLGRTVLVLGGAFFTRWLTEAGLLGSEVGTTLGLAYALLWAGAALRAAPPASASFHLLTAATIAYPLIAESATRFGSIRAPAAAALLLVTTAALLAVARRAALAIAAPVVSGAASMTAIFLSLRLHRPDLFAMALLAVGVGLAVARRPERAADWPLALTADLLTWASGVMALSGSPSNASVAVSVSLVLALALPLAYGVAILVRVHRGAGAGAFEIMQGTAALLVAALGAPRLAVAAGIPPLWLAAVAVLGSVVTGAEAMRRRAAGDEAGALFGAGAASALAGLAGGLFSSLVAVVCWCGLAAAWAAVGARQPRVAPLVSLACLGAAALRAGLAGEAPAVLLGGWQPHGDATKGAVTLAAGVAWVLFGPTEEGGRRGPSLAAGGLFLVGLYVQALALLGGLPGLHADSYGAATRSLLLAATAITVAAVPRLWSRPSARDLVVVVLVVAAGKLLLRDLFQSGPGPLFVEFAAYGLALVVVARRNASADARAGPRRAR